MKRKLGFLSAMLVGASTMAAEPAKVGGFVAAKLDYTDPGAANGKTLTNFSVPDAAIYFEHKLGNHGAKVDLPMMSATGSGAFSIAGTKTQALIWGKYDSGFGWKFGQFDTGFGLEGNDLTDITFTRHGIIKAQLPATSRGVALMYDFSDMMGVTFIVGNPNPGIVDGTGGNMPDNNPEYGMNFAAKFDQFHFNFGAEYGRIARKDRWGVVSSLTSEMDSLNFGLQIAYMVDAEAVATNKDKLMAGAEVGFRMNDSTMLATRFEWVKHDKARAIEWAIGPQFAMEENFEVRADYSYMNYNGSTSTGAKASKTLSDHVVAVAGVYTF